MASAPGGTTISQMVPPALICTQAAGLRDFLIEANQACTEVELQCWQENALLANASCQQAAQQEACLWRRFTKMRVKPFVRRGPHSSARVALFFGSFDPLHENHFRVILCALR